MLLGRYLRTETLNVLKTTTNSNRVGISRYNNNLTLKNLPRFYYSLSSTKYFSSLGETVKNPGIHSQSDSQSESQKLAENPGPNQTQPLLKSSSEPDSGSEKSTNNSTSESIQKSKSTREPKTPSATIAGINKISNLTFVEIREQHQKFLEKKADREAAQVSAKNLSDNKLDINLESDWNRPGIRPSRLSSGNNLVKDSDSGKSGVTEKLSSESARNQTVKSNQTLYSETLSNPYSNKFNLSQHKIDYKTLDFSELKIPPPVFLYRRATDTRSSKFKKKKTGDKESSLLNSSNKSNSLNSSSSESLSKSNLNKPSSNTVLNTKINNSPTSSVSDSTTSDSPISEINSLVNNSELEVDSEPPTLDPSICTVTGTYPTGSNLSPPIEFGLPEDILRSSSLLKGTSLDPEIFAGTNLFLPTDIDTNSSDHSTKSGPGSDNKLKSSDHSITVKSNSPLPSKSSSLLNTSRSNISIPDRLKLYTQLKFQSKSLSESEDLLKGNINSTGSGTKITRKPSTGKKKREKEQLEEEKRKRLREQLFEHSVSSIGGVGKNSTSDLINRKPKPRIPIHQLKDILIGVKKTSHFDSNTNNINKINIDNKMELRIPSIDTIYPAVNPIAIVAKATGVTDLNIIVDESIRTVTLKDDISSDPTSIEYETSILKHLTDTRSSTSPLFGGLSSSEKAQVDSWLEWSQTEMSDNATQLQLTKAMSTIENQVMSRKFMVDVRSAGNGGSGCSVADILLVSKVINRQLESPSDGGPKSVDELMINQQKGSEKPLARWIINTMEAVPELKSELCSKLDSYRTSVSTLKKKKKPIDDALLLLQKMKSLIGDLKADGSSNQNQFSAQNQNQPQSKKETTTQSAGNLGLGAIKEGDDETESTAILDPEKEARKAAKKAAKEKEKAEKAERKRLEEIRRKEGKKGIMDFEVEKLRLREGFPKPIDESNLGIVPYGEIFIQSDCIRTGRKFIQLNKDSIKENLNKKVWLRCRLHSARHQAKQVFLILRQNLVLVQAIADANSVLSDWDESNYGTISNPDWGKNLVTYTKSLTDESVVDIEALITTPPNPIASDMISEGFHNVELSIKRIYCISKAGDLPFTLSDATKKQEELGYVSQETRLNNRILDLRTSANQAILRIQSGVCRYFRDYLLSQNFTEIHSPKLLGGGSEGGAEVFKVSYFPDYNLPHAYLAQSPQLYKQMALMTGLTGVFEIGPIFRAENSFTHRHLTEFVGLDMEMLFTEHYHEVLEVLDRTFQYVFNKINEEMKSELEAVRKQYPFEDLLYERGDEIDSSTGKKKRSRIFTFKEVIDLLRTDGPKFASDKIKVLESKLHSGNLSEEEMVRLMDVIDKSREHMSTLSTHGYLEDLSTKDEKLLGEIIKSKYSIEFYMVDKFPYEVRPFYTMKDPTDPTLSNSYDIFIRGEEIMSGAQRIHDPEMLRESARLKGMEKVDESYIQSFSMGASPHGGGGVGLERVVMLFLGLDNIRKTSMFPRDPKRLAP